MRRSFKARGLTLIELIVAMAVMLVAVAAATTLMIAAMRMAHDRTGNVEAAERARLGSSEMLENLERAGLGSWSQVTVNAGSATPIMPIYFVDQSTGAGSGGATPDPVPGTDEVWMISPSRLALGEACFDSGAKIPLTAGNGATVTVACTNGLSNYTGAGRFVMLISNQGTGKAGLLSVPNILTATTFNSPDTGTIPTFAAGDSVVGVQVLHYYIGLNPNDKDPNGTQHPALYRAVGQLNASASIPFINAASPAPVAEISDVEDLQVAAFIDPLGTSNPANYTLDGGMVAPLAPPAQLRAMRVSLVARSHLRSYVSQNPAVYSQKLIAPNLENHVPGTAADGYERVVFSRRVELPNMAMTAF